MQGDYPVGKTQKMVLDAMGVKKYTFDGAEAYFSEIGIVVRAKRIGRTTQPEITVKRSGSGFSADGDGDTWKLGNDVDLTSISQWIVR